MVHAYNFGSGVELTCFESTDSLWQAVAGVKIRVFPASLNDNCKMLTFQLMVAGTVAASHYRTFKSRKALIAAWESMKDSGVYCPKAGESQPLAKHWSIANG